MNEFNKEKYDINYRKKFKSQFNVDLNKDEKDELDTMLKAKGLTKSEFLRAALHQLKNGKLDLKFEKKDYFYIEVTCYNNFKYYYFYYPESDSCVHFDRISKACIWDHIPRDNELKLLHFNEDSIKSVTINNYHTKQVVKIIK